MSHQFPITEMITRINVKGFRLQPHRTVKEVSMEILNAHVDAK